MNPTRPRIPQSKIIALCIRQAGGSIPCAETGEPITVTEALAGRVHIDHVPPLSQRGRTEDGGYIPDANNIAHLDLVSADGHKIRTFERRGLQRGDLTENAHQTRVAEKHAAHLGAMEGKRPGVPRERKGSIRSRGFQKRGTPC